MSDQIAVPKLPLSRVKSTTGFVWRQADGALFSAAEFEEWLWERLARANEADAADQRLWEDAQGDSI